MMRKTISMPDAMEEYVRGRVKSGMFGNDSEYFRELVRQDQARQTGVAQLQQAIDDAIESGAGARSLDEIWQTAKAKAARNV